MKMVLCHELRLDVALLQAIYTPVAYDGDSKLCPNCQDRMPEAGDDCHHDAWYCRERCKLRLADAVLESLKNGIGASLMTDPSDKEIDALYAQVFGADSDERAWFRRSVGVHDIETELVEHDRGCEEGWL
jgi:hypothetical protein